MNVLRVDRQLERLALLRRAARVDTGNGVVLFAVDFHIQNGFVTQLFDNVDLCGDDRVGAGLDEDLFVVNVLGTNAQNDVLADKTLVHQALGAGLRHFDLVDAEFCVQVAVLADQLGVEEVHLRRA